jgi:hypothetical protein
MTKAEKIIFEQLQKGKGAKKPNDKKFTWTKKDIQSMNK